MSKLAALGAIDIEAEAMARSVRLGLEVSVSKQGYVTRGYGHTNVVPHGYLGPRVIVEREEDVVKPDEVIQISQCVCFNRSDGSHSAECLESGYVPDEEELGPWKQKFVTESVLVKTSENSKEWSRTTRREWAMDEEREAIAREVKSDEIVALIDTETTGFARGAKGGSRIVEIAVLIADLAERKVIASLSSLLDPLINVPFETTKITGITGSMVRGQPRFEEFWPRVVALVAEHCPALDVVAHNASFDRGMIEDSIERAGLMKAGLPPWKWRCSIELAKKVVPGLPSYGLTPSPGKKPSLQETLGLKESKAHRAAGDVITAASLLRALRDRSGKPWHAWKGDAIVWGQETEREKATKVKPSKKKDLKTANIFEYAARRPK